MSMVKVDNKGRVLLSKELRRASGVEKNDHLLAKSLSKGKILLEKPLRQPSTKNDGLEWLLKHPAEINSKDLKDKIRKIRNTRRLIESLKEELWTGD